MAHKSPTVHELKAWWRHWAAKPIFPTQYIRLIQIADVLEEHDLNLDQVTLAFSSRRDWEIRHAETALYVGVQKTKNRPQKFLFLVRLPEGKKP